MVNITYIEFRPFKQILEYNYNLYQAFRDYSLNLTKNGYYNMLESN